MFRAAPDSGQQSDLVRVPCHTKTRRLKLFTEIPWRGSAMSKEYFVRISGQAFGPITAQQVVQLAAQGKLKASDFVREGQGQWVLACNVNGLVLADQLGSPGNQITSNVSSTTSPMIGTHDALQRQSRKPHLTAPVAIVLALQSSSSLVLWHGVIESIR